MALRWTALFPLVVALTVTFGCAPSEAPTPEDSPAPATEIHGTPEAESAVAVGAVTDRYWSLETFGARGVAVPPLEGTEITLALSSDGRVSGTGGCNRYFTSYESGEAGALSFGQIGLTRMACPTELMDQETAFLQALGDMARYEVDGDRLRLLTEDGTGALTFFEIAAPAVETE
jgi:heat shock protein HslJ